MDNIASLKATADELLDELEAEFVKTAGISKLSIDRYNVINVRLQSLNTPESLAASESISTRIIALMEESGYHFLTDNDITEIEKKRNK